MSSKPRHQTQILGLVRQGTWFYHLLKKGISPARHMQKYFFLPVYFRYIIAVCLLFLFMLLTPLLAFSGQSTNLSWKELAQGLEYTSIALQGTVPTEVAILRIDPTFFTFRAYSVSEEGGQALSLRQWAKRYRISAVINASMYLPDYATSTGYLRQDNHQNNAHIASKYQSFFMAEPKERQKDLPTVSLCDKDQQQCTAPINEYRTVVQNFRIITQDRRIVWQKKNSPTAISAVAQDGAGHILFLHSRGPISVPSFAEQLLALPLDIRATMYTEGGVQAGLYVETPAFTRLWGGRHAVDFLSNVQIHAPLPNVLGIVPRDSAQIQPSQP